MSVLLAFCSVLEVVYHQTLTPLSRSLSEPSAASSHGARCLASEHAVIVKEQTAQAIANTAQAYERSGVEAALNEVMGHPHAGGREGWARSRDPQSLTFPLLCVSAAFNWAPFLSPVFSYSLSPFYCHSLRKLNPRSPCPRKQPLQSSQSSPQRRRTQSLPPRLVLRRLKSRSPVWGGFWLELMQMDMMRRYRDECRTPLSLQPSLSLPPDPLCLAKVSGNS